MAEEQESAQRKAARMKMREALELFEGRHPERGVETMKDVLELDPDFIEPRKWLADHYADTGQDRLAISQYETMLRIEPDNDDLWDGLRAIDPRIADKLERLQHVAPDPFAAAGASVDTSDLDDFEDENDELDEDREAATPFQGDAAGDDVFLDDDTVDTAPYESLAWDHEQDPELRGALDSNSAFVDVMDGFMLLWQDSRTWSRMLVRCVPPNNANWPQLDPLLATAAAALEAPMPLTVVAPEHTPWPLCLPLQDETLVLGEPLRTALNQPELLFILGASLHLFLNDNAQYAWAAEQVIERKVDKPGLHDKVVETARDFTVGWDQALPREEVVRLSKLAHGWEQRAVLSADRAGLLVCADPPAACRAIAIMVGDPFNAPTVTVDGFLAQFKDIPRDELAAISLSRSPWTDPQYAAYRIQMLRWWATTADYKRLIGG